MEMFRIGENDSDCLNVLRYQLGCDAPSCLYAMGELSILRHRLLGLICSIQCPGGIVIQTFDAVRALRDAGVVVIGGFHSPMERECLDLLLRGRQPVVLCAARGLAHLRLGPTARQALGEGRLLVLSPFGPDVRRTTSAQAMRRNEVVAGLARAVWAPHAAPGGRTRDALRRALARGQSVFLFEDEGNAELIRLGAIALDAHALAGAFLNL